MVGADEDVGGVIALSAAAAAVGDDRQRDTHPLRGRLERAAYGVVAAEAEEREAIAQLLEGIAAGGERLGRQMVSRARRERVRAERAAAAAGKTPHDRGARVVWLVRLRPIAEIALARLPGALEIGAIVRRIVPIEERLVARDPRRDEVLGDFAEDRTALGVVGGEQCICGPAVQSRGKSYGR